MSLNSHPDRRAAFGATTYPAGSSVLFLDGGNPGLQPESANTWTVSAALHPDSIKGLVVEVSYFNVHYRQRIQSPISSAGQALIDPNNRLYVEYNPSTADIAQAIAGRIFNNYTGAPYNPASVVAIINDVNLNAVNQSIHGFDMSAKYRFSIGKLGAIQLSGSGAYLDSNQQLSASSSVTQLAGTVYNPPHFRGRAGASWQNEGMTLTSYVNYTGSVTDTRINYASRSGAMTTIDLSAHYKFTAKTGLTKGLDLSASALNIFNAAPRSMKTGGVYDTPYDPLNYSPVGRFLGLTISKDW